MNHSLSDKGQRLVNMYSEMAEHGYATNIGVEIKDAYNSFEPAKYVMLSKLNLQNTTLAPFLIMVVADQLECSWV